MKNLIKILVGIILTMSNQKGIGQTPILYLSYKPTSHYLIDTTWAFEEYDLDEFMPSIVGFDSLEVYLTPKYFAAKSFSSEVLIHTVYNRQTRIIRRHFIHHDSEFFSEDSVMYYLHQNKRLRKIAESLKDSLWIKEYPHIQKTIHGKKCYLITQPVYVFLSGHNDSLWLADFKDIPALIGPGFEFLISGIPLEWEVNDGLLSVRVTSLIKSETDLPKDVFTIDPGLSELHQMQTQDKIPRLHDLFSDE